LYVSVIKTLKLLGISARPRFPPGFQWDTSVHTPTNLAYHFEKCRAAPELASVRNLRLPSQSQSITSRCV